jgi:hypothetical protein
MKVRSLSFLAAQARDAHIRSRCIRHRRRQRQSNSLPSHDHNEGALTAVWSRAQRGGFSLNMWATIVNRDGEVVAVAFTGNDRGAQWPGSRVISAQKANTANAFSLPDSRAFDGESLLRSQPGGSLYGLQHSNPVDTQAAYRGESATTGSTMTRWSGRR